VAGPVLPVVAVQALPTGKGRTAALPTEDAPPAALLPAGAIPVLRAVIIPVHRVVAVPALPVEIPVKNGMPADSSPAAAAGPGMPVPVAVAAVQEEGKYL
jgi:hypothetical protein